ncbi:MAG: glycosyltransferase family 4 protein [Methylacidiphilales bacterium]|nr:glycosyltransferase family 4 protein [Candidatus Methylacidiphilales bacterium]
MRLTFIISSLSHGGAERVMSIMANYWVKKGWKVTILTFAGAEMLPDYDLDERVTHIPLGLMSDSYDLISGLWNNIHRILRLRDAIYNSKPDVVISFIDTVNVLTLIASKNLKIPVLVSERNNPAKYYIGNTWEKLRNWTYLSADRIVVQTQRIYDCLSPQLQARACVIPNPILSTPIRKHQHLSKGSDDFSLIAMGRLNEQKGFDLLIQAFAKIKDKHPKWKLTILGEGSLRSQLEAIRDSLGLSQHVYFPGRVKNPSDYLLEADLFVLSSRFEGFPNALCEAMACGRPVISFDCDTGPREIIRNGVDGMLVPNEDVFALTQAMDSLMSDQKKRQNLAAKAPEVVTKFSLDKVMEIWEKVLNDVCY